MAEFIGIYKGSEIGWDLTKKKHNKDHADIKLIDVGEVRPESERPATIMNNKKIEGEKYE